MIKHYIYIAIRSLLKNKAYNVINIIGLSIALASVLVIVSYVQLELSYDRFHKDYKNIYRITTDWVNDGKPEHSAKTFSALSPFLTDNLAGLNRAVRIFPYSGLASTDKINKTRENKFCFADSTFFELFTFSPLEGSLKDALVSPFSVVITKSVALRYFGTDKVVGKELFLETSRATHSYNIVSIIEDIPQNSHFNVDFIASYSSLEKFSKGYMANWSWPPMYLYLQTEGQTAVSITNQLKAIAEQHLPPDAKEQQSKFIAQPIEDIHLNSNLQNEWHANSSYTYIKVFSFIAGFILILACINFMNLATAQSFQRAREVGVRKALGSLRVQLVRMFMSESLMVVAFSFVVGVALAHILSATLFSDYVGKELDFAFMYRWPGVVSIIFSIVLVAVLAGLYPSFYLSSFNAIKALAGRVDNSRSMLGLRKVLLIFQFSVSAILLASMWVVMQQTDYLRNKDLGFEKERLLNIGLNDKESQEKFQILKDKLREESFVVNATAAATLPGNGEFYGWQVAPEGFTDREDLFLKSINADEDFIKTLGIKVVTGRDFSQEIMTDKEQAFIVNRAAAEKFGWADPVGKDFQLTFYTNDAVVRTGKIIGMVEDFHYQSLYNRIEPLVILINTHPYYTDFLSVRLAPGDLNKQIERIKEVWTSFNPSKPFEYSFLDEELNLLYKREEATGKLLSLFTFLSVLIAGLGLVGLASFSVQQRTKEIGVRKVLGASVSSILSMLTKDFVILVVLANLIGLPLAWYIANQWLSTFAYQINIGAGVLLITCLTLLTATILIVCIQSFRTALMNPVKSLRQE